MRSVTVVGTLIVESFPDHLRSVTVVRLRDAEKFVVQLVTDEEIATVYDIKALREHVVVELCKAWKVRFGDNILPGPKKEGQMWSFKIIPHDPGVIDGEVVSVTYPGQKEITDGRST